MMFPPNSFPLKNTTIRIPSRGLGTFQVDPKIYPEGSVKDSVLQALKLGYRHIDAAFGYGWGQVERDIGEAIHESGIPREELFIVTKLYAYFIQFLTFLACSLFFVSFEEPSSSCRRFS
jgi:diketogulonate reductase-like aldo/keto reductase